MEQQYAVNVALDCAGVLMLVLMLYPLLRSDQKELRRDRRLPALFAAGMLHLIAECMQIASGTRVLTGTPSSVASPYLYSALLLDFASVLMLAIFLLADTDGQLHLRKRNARVSIARVAAAIVPSLLALGLEMSIPGVGMLGIAYALSLNLVYLLFTMESMRDLSEREEELNVRQTRLMAEQMQPHFIFNSLSSIQALCMIDPNAAARCVENFAGYLRGNIDGLTSDEPIRFEQELAHIRQYVELERADPARQFTVEYDLQVRDFLIPALTVQPIMENAVKHGALSHEDGTGRVVLRTESIGSFIRITVEDNGLNGVMLTARQQRSRGIGFKNTKDRLAACGGSLRIQTDAGGTTAIITVPAANGGEKDVHTDG